MLTSPIIFTSFIVLSLGDSTLQIVFNENMNPKIIKCRFAMFLLELLLVIHVANTYFRNSSWTIQDANTSISKPLSTSPPVTWTVSAIWTTLREKASSSFF